MRHKSASEAPGVAVDLGCGSGPDAIEQLRRGWTVHAVDAEGKGLAMPGVLTLSEEQVRFELAPLEIEAFDIEDGYRVSGGEITRWHAFGIAARRAMPP